MKGLITINSEKRMIESYEEQFSIRFAKQEIILAENLGNEEPYLICNCRSDNSLGLEMYDNLAISHDYLEIMQEFTKRLSDGCKLLEAERTERGLQHQPLYYDVDCISKSQHMNYEGQVIVIRQGTLAPEYRSAEYQLALCSGGFGARPNSRGRAVNVTELYSGEQSRWNRSDIAGIIAPERMPEWAKEKLAALQKQQEKKSVAEQIKEGQPTQEKPNKPKPKKDGPEH